MPKEDSAQIKEILALLKDVQANIKDMVETFAKLPAGKHRATSGELLLTTKEKEVLKLIRSEQARADQLVKWIAKNGSMI
jgi:hypothetical protein